MLTALVYMPLTASCLLNDDDWPLRAVSKKRGRKKRSKVQKHALSQIQTSLEFANAPVLSKLRAQVAIETNAASESAAVVASLLPHVELNASCLNACGRSRGSVGAGRSAHSVCRRFPQRDLDAP